MLLKQLSNMKKYCFSKERLQENSQLKSGGELLLEDGGLGGFHEIF